MIHQDSELKLLVDQFTNMSSADRKMILRKIPVKQRIRLKRLMSGKDGFSSAAAVYEETDIQTLDQNDFSDWLLATMDDRKRSEMWGLRKEFHVTPRTSRTLAILTGQQTADAADRPTARNSDGASASVSGAASPSLIEKMGGLFVKKPSQS